MLWGCVFFKLTRRPSPMPRPQRNTRAYVAAARGLERRAEGLRLSRRRRAPRPARGAGGRGLGGSGAGAGAGAGAGRAPARLRRRGRLGLAASAAALSALALAAAWSAFFAAASAFCFEFLRRFFFLLSSFFGGRLREIMVSRLLRGVSLSAAACLFDGRRAASESPNRPWSHVSFHADRPPLLGRRGASCLGCSFAANCAQVKSPRRPPLLANSVWPAPAKLSAARDRTAMPSGCRVDGVEIDSQNMRCARPNGCLGLRRPPSARLRALRSFR